MPKGLTCIEKDAFKGCKSIIYLEIPKTLNQVGYGVFDAEINFSKTPSGVVTYNGKARTLAVEVKLNGKILIENTDYTVNYKDNTNVGTATVTIRGIGSYSGVKNKTFTIKQLSVVGGSVTYTITKDGILTYNGKERKPAIAVNVNGVTLEANKDYTVEYSNNKEVGTGTVKVIGKGNYCATVSRTFKIMK